MTDDAIRIILRVPNLDANDAIRLLLNHDRRFVIVPDGGPHDALIVQTPAAVEGHVHLCGLAARWPSPCDLARVAEWCVDLHAYLTGSDEGSWKRRRKVFWAGAYAGDRK